MPRIALALALAHALAAAASPALAEAPMTAEDFDAYVTGHTITYRQFDFTFGIEEYLPDRKVRWSVAPGVCQYGSWYTEGPYICFVYEYNPVPHCWTFWMEGGTMKALSDTGQPDETLTAIDRGDQPLACPGPDVGV